MARPKAVMIVDPGSGDYISVVGDTYRILMHGKQTDNAFAAIEMIIPPNGGPDPHAHAAVEETFFITAGEVVVRTETQTYTAREGSFVRVPRGGAVHNFTNETDAVARLLCVLVPAGLETFFEEVGEPVTTEAFLPKPELSSALKKEFAESAERHGVEMFPLDFFTGS